MKDWKDVREWRRERREELLRERRKTSAQVGSRAAAAVSAAIIEHALVDGCTTLGFYWPFKGELDLRPLVHDLMQQGITVALPVVVEKNRPVEFWTWWPGMRLLRGIWNIPIPSKRLPVRPDSLVVPLLGFDGAGYRLGYGGGYYDRTLAALLPKPLAIGVGMERGCLPTIHPQPHDIAMDVIVTEQRVMRVPQTRAAAGAYVDDDEDPNAARSYASPPCFMHEFE